jgi:hypothetical protein
LGDRADRVCDCQGSRSGAAAGGSHIMGCGASKQSKSASWGNRHCATQSRGGKPDNAVGFASEGNFAIAKKDHEKFVEPLDAQLMALGVTDTEWASAVGKLREAHSAVGGGSNFKAAIEQLNTTLFNAKGCHAVYAEYGGKGGQKAMTVYTKEVWDSLPE